MSTILFLTDHELPQDPDLHAQIGACSTSAQSIAATRCTCDLHFTSSMPGGNPSRLANAAARIAFRLNEMPFRE